MKPKNGNNGSLSRRLGIRVTEEEYAEIKKRADRGGMGISEYCRDALLRSQQDGNDLQKRLERIESATKSVLLSVHKQEKAWEGGDVMNALKKVFEVARRNFYALDSFAEVALEDQKKLNLFHQRLKAKIESVKK